NGVQTVKTAAALARGGLRTRLLVRRSDPAPTAEVLAQYGLSPPDGLEVRRLPVLHRAGAFALPRALFLARAGAQALGWMRGGGLVFTRDLQLADLLLRLPGGRRLVYEAHAVEAVMYAERGALYGTGETPSPRKVARLRARERRVWRRAAAVVTTTAGIRDSFQEAWGERQRVAVVPNGCDPPPAQLPPPSAERPPRVLYAGQLYPWKGVDVLVEAMAAVPEARLVILGGLPGERDRERVRARVDALGLGPRTEMPGTVAPARVGEELARAAVVVVPVLRTAMTERHTSPLKAFEAMAAGRPLVASDLPSSREILRQEETALLVPPGDTAALAAALRRVLQDGALAARLARAAWREASAFSWDARAARLRALFAEAGA
ncbi:MAG TPA: glycosyltransferase, partial [Vicinamibacteria bacterium]|nr:glycosyltransferase [Vicinamibacteria bacterium]